jgi:hypothetical protein
MQQCWCQASVKNACLSSVKKVSAHALCSSLLLVKWRTKKRQHTDKFLCHAAAYQATPGTEVPDIAVAGVLCSKRPAATGQMENDFETYTIKGEKYLATLNGPAAQKLKDDIIIISYATMEFEAAKTFKPWVIFPNENDNSLT